MLRRPTIYFQIPFEIPAVFVEEYRYMFETLYGAHSHLTDGEIIRLGFKHYRDLDVYNVAHYDFSEDLGSDSYSLVIDPKEWDLFFGNELSPLSPREELDEVLQYRFDFSFCAMKYILQEEKRYNWKQYDIIMEGIPPEDALYFLRGIKMMALRDGGKLLKREMYSFAYLDTNQNQWHVQYSEIHRWVRRYRFSEVE